MMRFWTVLTAWEEVETGFVGKPVLREGDTVTRFDIVTRFDSVE